jgi:hypothetical protein
MSGHDSVVGENFPEGTSASDPSAVPPFDPERLEEEPEEGTVDEKRADVGRDDPSEETDAEEAPESQQAG